jgi:hypothetical protein
LALATGRGDVLDDDLAFDASDPDGHGNVSQKLDGDGCVSGTRRFFDEGWNRTVSLLGVRRGSE